MRVHVACLCCCHADNLPQALKTWHAPGLLSTSIQRPNRRPGNSWFSQKESPPASIQDWQSAAVYTDISMNTIDVLLSSMFHKSQWTCWQVSAHGSPHFNPQESQRKGRVRALGSQYFTRNAAACRGIVNAPSHRLAAASTLSLQLPHMQQVVQLHQLLTVAACTGRSSCCE